MKIVFVGLSSFYTVGMRYQDNLFCKCFLDRGHNVVFISNPEKYVNGIIEYTGAEDKVLSDGLHLIRDDFRYGYFFSKIFKIYKNIYNYLETINPDIIYCHGTQYFNIFDVVAYKKRHKDVVIYADTHTSFINYKKGFFSYWFLYKMYYRHLYKTIEPYLEKYFYIGLGEKEFSEKVYSADSLKMEFLPLGGEEISTEEYSKHRKEIRDKYNIDNDDIMLFHSGKLLKGKNTDWIINAINKVNKNNVKLFIAGSIPEENKELKNRIISNKNIIYIGWISGDELVKYLCACDLYCQPGTPSVTLQTAICSKTPIICYKHDFYSYLYDYNSILWINNVDDIVACISNIVNNRTNLEVLKKNADKNSYKLDTAYLLSKALGV